MFSKQLMRARWYGALLLAASVFSAMADGWNYWGHVGVVNFYGARIATDGTNLFYSTLQDGVYRASLTDRYFTKMPMTGYPLWDANTNDNGFGLATLAVTPAGQLLISGSPINVTPDGVFPGPVANSLPVFYWWDDSNQLWQAASVTNQTYPYTTTTGNFTFAPDGSVWTCSGYAPYAYRSTDNGHSYVAFNLDALVPANYLPMPNGQTTFGKIFSILATPQNQIIVGTETGGYLCTTNNGANWLSLDPNFTDVNTTNPLGRVTDALVAGCDKYGNVLCRGLVTTAPSASLANWASIPLIGWRPQDNSVFVATNGIPYPFAPAYVATLPSGDSFGYMNQNYLLQGGVYRSSNGKNWTQFNTHSPLNAPFGPGLTNALEQGGIITTLGQTVFIGAGASSLYTYDDTPPPVTNRPPVALAQAVNLWQNSPTNLTLTGSDPDGDALNFTITVQPIRGTLSGTPPDLTYTPANNAAKIDQFQFVVDDGMATSAPAIFNLAVNPTTNPPPLISFSTSPQPGGWGIAPTNIVLTATASDNDGPVHVTFYDGMLPFLSVSNAPYVLVLTNPAIGDHTFFAYAADMFNAHTWAQPAIVSVLPAAPNLNIQQVDAGDVGISWPVTLDGFFTETAPNATGPWTLSPYAPLYSTNGQTVTIPTSDQQFFRLMHPH